ncbi:MAG: hypothetical protein BWY51_00918 [Parcubacteria group bacterium ADurb.Bin316]|nr:MAG: hypothetical protein BWY51_00918 [Parcubacteria group bacterium ADurb.Bin316]
MTPIKDVGKLRRVSSPNPLLGKNLNTISSINYMILFKIVKELIC